MDPLSALSVAASVAQFLEFGCSLVSKTRQIYKSASGATISQAETTIATRRLLELTQRLKASLEGKITPGLPEAPDTAADEELGGEALEAKILENKKLEEKRSEERRLAKSFEAICKICDSCVLLSNELLGRLKKLEVEEGVKHRKFKSLRQALKSVWSSSEICDITDRLQSLRRELNDHLTVSLCEKFNTLKVEDNLHLVTDTKFNSLDRTLQDSLIEFRDVLSDAHQKLKDGLESQRLFLEKFQRERLATAEEEYLQHQRSLDEAADLALLSHLQFPSMSDRREEIVGVHRNTFSWIFKDPEAARISLDVAENTRPWTNFVEWLQRENGIYWINGKAGSGKSTLMRFISENPETREHLQQWAGSAELRIASFYFWSSGSKEQCSQPGLLRSLLWEILRSRRDLVRCVFKSEWEESRTITSQFEFNSVLERVRSFQRLKEAFAHIVSLASDQLKFCFFIDGLDEYEGDSEDIICLFRDIPTSPFLKFCLSSRPSWDFEKAFEAGPKLRLQDLTYKDIRVYVCDKLESHHQVLQLFKSHPTQKADFVKEILSKANGVFLWVHLVTRSLLNGIKYGDDMTTLQNRLKATPPKLEDLYAHMLSSIEPVYMEHASRLFQIYNAASDVDVRPTVLELDLTVTATYAEAMTPVRSVMSEEEIEERCDKMISCLKIRCGGLLEAHDRLDTGWEGNDDGEVDVRWHSTSQTRSEVEKSHIYKIRADTKVSYLHRTVSDYLKGPSVRSNLERHTRLSSKFESFDPNLSLLMSYPINLKRHICSFYFDAEPSLDNRVWKTTNDVCHIAQKVSNSKNPLVIALLQQFDIVGRHWWLHQSMDPESPFRGRDSPSNSAEWQKGLLCVAVHFGLSSFVEAYLKTNRVPQGLPGHTILMYALGLKISPNYPGAFFLLKQPASPGIVDLLLQHGENPNKPVIRGSYTVWMYFLITYRIESTNGINSEEHFRRWALIFKSMLHYGADITDKVVGVDPPDIPLWEFEKPQDHSDWRAQAPSLEALINELVAKAPPDVSVPLRREYQRRKQRETTLLLPGPGYSSGSSSPRKRPFKIYNELKQLDGSLCIDLLDDSDDDSINSATSYAPELRERRKIKRSSSPQRMIIDLT